MADKKACKLCSKWSYAYTDKYKQYGLCNEPNVYEEIKLADGNDNNIFYTYALFECKYFEEIKKLGGLLVCVIPKVKV